MPEYTCECCGETYLRNWSDEEAMAEAEANGFGDKQEEMAIVCDDCYKEIMCLRKRLT